jgi:hypothetical protein
VPEETPRRRRRGEGEVTQWPRGLLEYTTKGALDAAPDPEEDRTGNRIRIAARLIGVLRSQGQDVQSDLEALQAAERAYRAGRRAEATERIERLLGRLAPTPPRSDSAPTS